MSVADYLANKSTLDATAGFGILDSAADVSAAFDTLDGDSKVTSITVSDDAKIAISATQLASDAAAIGKLANADDFTFSARGRRHAKPTSRRTTRP